MSNLWMSQIRFCHVVSCYISSKHEFYKIKELKLNNFFYGSFLLSNKNKYKKKTDFD